MFGILGLGATVDVPSGAADAKKNELIKRASDLFSFGLINANERVVILRSIGAGNYSDAEGIIAEKEGKQAKKNSAPAQAGIFKKVTEILPSGYGFKDELITGVPNWALYLAGTTFAVLTYGALRKR